MVGKALIGVGMIAFDEKAVGRLRTSGETSSEPGRVLHSESGIEDYMLPILINSYKKFSM